MSSDVVEKETAGEPLEEPHGLANKLVGTILSWLAVGLFYFTCIILPLVGQAGKVTPHAGLNYLTFTAVVLIALAVSGTAFASRIIRRKQVGGGLPWIQAGLVSLNLVILLALVTGMLGI